VAFPANAFARSNNQVPTQALIVEAIDQRFAVAPNIQVLGSFSLGEADTEPLRVRKMMYLPARYAALLLGGSRIPREAWTLIGDISVRKTGWKCATPR
jgi:hypothetical protein